MGQCPLDLTALWGKETDECHPTRWLHRSVAVISTVCRQKLWVKVKQQRPPGAPLKTQVCVPSGGEAETHRPATKKGSVPHRLRGPCSVRGVCASHVCAPCSLFLRSGRTCRGSALGLLFSCSHHFPLRWLRLCFRDRRSVSAGELPLFTEAQKEPGSPSALSGLSLLCLSPKPISASSLKKCNVDREQNEVIAKNNIP